MPEDSSRPVVRNQHYVPRHYLRQFGYPDTELISVARIEPYKFISQAGIGGQCKEDYFYGEDGEVDELMQLAENDLAPALRIVCQQDSISPEHLNALSLLTALLHLRTKKAVDRAKLPYRWHMHRVIQEGIDARRIPPPPGGVWTFEMAQVEGFPGVLIKATIPCWLETYTLNTRLLMAPEGSAFVTSDNPVILLNQFAQGADPVLSYAGFGQSGFQILLPLSPRHCLFFYDSKTYDVGTSPAQRIDVQKLDVETINALQVQSAERCLYFNDTVPEEVAKDLVDKYRSLHVPTDDAMRIYPGSNPDEVIFHFREPVLKVVKPLSFCRLTPNPPVRPGDRRDPYWTGRIERLLDDMDKGLVKGDLITHWRSILAQL